MANIKKKNWKSIILTCLLVFSVIMFLLSCILNELGRIKNSIAYNELLESINNNEVAKIEATHGSNEVIVRMNNKETKYTVIPSLDVFTEFVSAEIEEGMQVEFIVKEKESNGIVDFFKSFLKWTIIFFVVTKVVSIILNKNKDSLMKFVDEDSPSTTEAVTSKIKFKDVAGIEEEKEQLMEIVKFLKNGDKYSDAGAKAPKGILLYGGPGTGKTLLAKAIAGEANVPFFHASGSDFDEKYYGVGASRVRKLFAKAKAAAPAIIFIDEIDSVARDRRSDTPNDQTLNQILAEMDGFNSKNDVIVIAATNRKEILDPAILRPGRFDRQIYVPMPDVVARENILKVHARNKNFSDSVSFADIAKNTVGFSGADLENLLNEAAIYAVNNDRKCIHNSDIDEALARVMVGLKKKQAKISEEDKMLTAIHEAGHAVVSAVLRPDVDILSISIVPRGTAGGYNYFGENDKRFTTKNDLMDEMAVLYGGRVAEEILLGDISSGASNDLERASKIAYQMAAKFAMNGKLMVKIISSTTEFDTNCLKEAEKICETAYASTSKIVKDKQDVIEKLADLLFDKESLSQDEISEFMKANLN